MNDADAAAYAEAIARAGRAASAFDRAVHTRRLGRWIPARIEMWICNRLGH